jgi:hypothetical protein
MHSINAAQKAAAMPPASTGAQKAKRAQSLAVGPEGERLRTHMLTAACLRRRIGDPNLGHESTSPWTFFCLRRRKRSLLVRLHRAAGDALR